MNKSTAFPRMRKADVNGENELPPYTWRKARTGIAGLAGHPDEADRKAAGDIIRSVIA